METTGPHILTVNTGSSSIKFSVYDMDERSLLKGEIAGIGRQEGSVRVFFSDGSICVDENTRIESFRKGAVVVTRCLEETGYVGSIEAVGYRIVHGGMKYREHCQLTEELLEYLRDIAHLAPEHLPQAVEVIEEVERGLPSIPGVACFDTAFHRDMPEESRIYAIPLEFYREGIMRYGFHGLSYEYITDALCACGVPLDRVIIAHLGHGSSMTAIRDGRCVETTMGFTPLAGLVMSTRCGDIDPGVVLYLLREKGFSADRLNLLLNHGSGLLGISGRTDDIRKLLALEKRGDERAILSLRLFCHSVRKFIGSLSAVLGGLSTLVFTAGIGENSPEIRERILDGLEFLGIRLDTERNRANQKVISDKQSRVMVMVIKTDEERMIARHTKRILNGEGR